MWFGWRSLDENLKIAIRSYVIEDTLHYLIVDPNNLSTETAEAISFKSKKLMSDDKSGYFSWSELQNTPYGKALKKYSSPPYLLQNYGLTHSQNDVGGMFLSVDLCPSVRPFEIAFFEKLVALADESKQAIPVAIAISGLWLVHHQKEFNWLLEQQKKNKLDITWVNHSFSHVYHRDLKLEKNFMLFPHTNVSNEILATEKLLLQNNVLPTIFFRFPGLVSDENVVKTLNNFGLIPIGSNAWLAKEEKAELGSIVLIHGNGNEPKGIDKALKLLQQNNQTQIPWLPLKQAF